MRIVGNVEVKTLLLNKRKKKPLYFLSNKPPYIGSLDSMKSQIRVYSIITQPEYHERV